MRHEGTCVKIRWFDELWWELKVTVNQSGMWCLTWTSGCCWSGSALKLFVISWSWDRGRAAVCLLALSTLPNHLPTVHITSTNHPQRILHSFGVCACVCACVCLYLPKNRQKSTYIAIKVCYTYLSFWIVTTNLLLLSNDRMICVQSWINTLDLDQYSWPSEPATGALTMMANTHSSESSFSSWSFLFF